jgi:hypothetical protein
MAKKKKTVNTAENTNEKNKVNETTAQSGSDYEHSVFLNVQAAYEEAKRKRENYKKIGPVFVAVSGIVFLTLIFTLENKITFLILLILLLVILLIYSVGILLITISFYLFF